MKEAYTLNILIYSLRTNNIDILKAHPNERRTEVLYYLSALNNFSVYNQMLSNIYLNFKKYK